MRLRAAFTAAVLAVMALSGAPSFAQDYNPKAGAAAAPSDGTLITPASPNGVDWLNSMLGLSPNFLSSTGQVNAAYVSVDLSGYVTQAALTSSLAPYLKTAYAQNTFLPLTGGTLSGDLSVKGQVNEYGNVTVMNGLSQTFLPSDTGVAGVNIQASNYNYGYLRVTNSQTGSLSGLEAAAALLASLQVNGDINYTGSLSTTGSARYYNTSVSDSNGASLFLNASAWLQLYYWGSSNVVNGFQAHAFMEDLTTPASSSASCTAGQFTDDASYHYVCVATDTWKRVALESF